ncbi:hypothetical protein LCGC14_1696350 [marine sediment metagenome]|uniref:DUF4062 domain-containing protein n=1 Tax=marine sediment metagenome TaxID=412755 RepID=A0A0F9JZS8_9ZZZZ
MSYNAVVCNVMIASPADVQQERLLARETLWNWNYLHCEQSQIVLMPIGWDTHSAPAMDDRPQGIINKQVVERSDLLIGIFWTRLGTPSGEADSGTVEEIEKHLAAGKPAMLYFSSAPVRPESVDAEQFAALRKFKDQCKEKGLIATYEDPAQFAAVLQGHLVHTVNDHSYFQDIRSASGSVATQAENPEPSVELDLSKEARDLLLEAAKDPNGTVLKVRTFGGLTVQANKKNMVTAPKDGRCEALWEGAVDELVENDLMADVGYKGEVFRVTRAGYELADSLAQQA